jgi:hypothetical protein
MTDAYQRTVDKSSELFSAYLMSKYSSEYFFNLLFLHFTILENILLNIYRQNLNNLNPLTFISKNENSCKQKGTF